jgi:uncharacterized protein YecT (DUF1311 family)
VALVLVLPRSRALVALIAVAFALSTAPVAAAASSTSLAAPVIKETFTRLPCNHSTTIGLEGCAEGQLLAADGRINKEVRLLFSLFPTTSERRLFVTAEDRWFTYRSADCESFSDIDHGGTMVPVLYANCEVVDDQARSADLHDEFRQLEQGAASLPAWP